MLSFLCLGVMLLAFSAQGLVAQYLQRHSAFDKPYLMVWTNHSFLCLLLPPVLAYIYVTKPGGGSGGPLLHPNEQQPLMKGINDDTEVGVESSSPCQWSLSGYMAVHGYSIRAWWLTGLWVSLLYLLPNYAFFVGLPMKGMTVTTACAVFNSNCAFAALFAACLRRHCPPPLKVLGVLLALGGVAMIALQISPGELKSRFDIHCDISCLLLALTGRPYCCY